MRYAWDGWAIDQYKKNGKPLPQWFLDRPPSIPGDDFYLRAFWRLSTERQIGPGYMGLIPWSKIQEYSDRQGLDYDLAELFEAVIGSLDEAFIEAQSKRKKQQRGA